MATSSEADVKLQTTDLRPYIRAGIIGTAVIWLFVILFILFWPATYTSSWGLMVLGTDPAVNVNLQEIGTASADASRQAEYQDPRDDYIYIATSLDTLAAAAKIVGIEPEEFEEPEIVAEPDRAIIEFEVDGDTPEQAQAKSMALYNVLRTKIDQLRQEEIDRRKAETMTNLDNDQEFLNESQLKIADFKARSPYHVEDQIKTLASSIEELRASLSEQVAQMRGLQAKLDQISSHKTVSASEVFDAYLLQSDPAYKSQFDQYGQVFSEFATLDVAVGENHPDLLAKKGEMQSILEAMSERAAFVLDRNVDEKELVHLNSLVVDPQMVEWANTYSDFKALEASTAEMENQISLLEQRLTLLDQENITFSRVQADFLVAESVLASTIAKLGLNQEGIYSIYPPVQLAVHPNLPEEKSVPDPQVASLAGAAATFLLVALLIFLIWERNSPWRNPRAWVP
ncbi:MAG: hypothetical protein HYR49_06775 [Gammaproteobacteria bacterium]|nr:hypothetical protein [Gammaproteobacteria bacterium]